MIHGIGTFIPDTKEAAFIAWNAEVAGRVSLGEGSSVWFGAVLRGDIAPIQIGKRSNIQDNVTVHVDHDVPTIVGDDVTVGHNAVLHSCTIGNGSLVGMGAVVLSGAVIGEESVVGAGALVTEGALFPPRSLIIGSPARALRKIDDTAADSIRANALRYLERAREAGNWTIVSTGMEQKS